MPGSIENFFGSSTFSVQSRPAFRTEVSLLLASAGAEERITVRRQGNVSPHLYPLPSTKGRGNNHRPALELVYPPKMSESHFFLGQQVFPGCGRALEGSKGTDIRMAIHLIEFALARKPFFERRRVASSTRNRPRTADYRPFLSSRFTSFFSMPPMRCLAK